MDREQKIELLRLLEEKSRRANVYRYKTYYETRYPWQKKFIALSIEYSQVALIAANRVGKTDTATYIDAIHAMGDYPDDWEGYKFDHPPLIWCLGYSGEKIRDLLQVPILGRKADDGWSGGLIPGDRIISTEAAQGAANSVRSAYIRHNSGGISKIQFWSYSQGQHALMGDSVDWFHIDEEPKDPTIYPQVLTRTATGDRGRGGRGILTFTPENGRTDLVIGFMDNPSSAQICMNVGWDDAPHLSEKVKTELLASYPPHQRDMRTKGIPMLGHGRIYDLGEDYIKCDPFPIPDHYFVIDGMDFGWDHPQAHVQLAWDTENETFYLTRAYKARQVSPAEAFSGVKQWAENVPTAWPNDGLQTEKGSGLQQKSYYEEAGFNMLLDPAQWEDGSRSVEPGLFEIYDLMRRGKFKVFSGLRDFFEEYNFYHRDEKGKIVKVRDDILDAVRYAYMMRRYAVRYGEVGKPKANDYANYNIPCGVG
ncbi:TPA: terminase large subunit domain-containing protein [Providencia alcalifaciens]